ncbi:MAG TPA: hypothetical protein VLC06_20495 [Polyangia bacterium]|nr:hypothetical protein [Polyangia bacterium]
MRTSIAIATLLLAASCGSVSSINNDGGRGGSPGTGGATGTGGNQGTGGNNGSGGSTSGLTCDQIQADYQAALAAARGCSVGGSNQCQKTVSNALGCNGCPTFVNDDSGLSQDENAWNQAGCSQNQVCANIACLAPKAATCKASDAGGATCVDSFVATPAN